MPTKLEREKPARKGGNKASDTKAYKSGRERARAGANGGNKILAADDRGRNPAVITRRSFRKPSVHSLDFRLADGAENFIGLRFGILCRA